MIDGVLTSSTLISDSIQNWVPTVLQQYSESQPILDCRVVALEHRKNRGGSEHEYILLKLRYTGLQKRHVRFIRIDRSFHRNTSRVVQQYTALLRGRPLAADDVIIITPTAIRTGSISLYEAYFDHDHAPSIVDLAIVLDAISFLSPDYDLWKEMCYWHARMVFEGLTRTFDGRVEEGAEPNKRGKFAGFLTLVDEEGRFVVRRRNFMQRVSDVYELPTLPRVLERISFMRAELMLVKPHDTEVHIFMLSFAFIFEKANYLRGHAGQHGLGVIWCDVHWTMCFSCHLILLSAHQSVAVLSLLLSFSLSCLLLLLTDMFVAFHCD